MRKKSFRSMFFLLAVSLAVIPAGVLSYVAISRLSDQIEQSSMRELQLRADQAARQVSFELARVADRLHAVAADSDVRRGVKSAFFLEKTDTRLSELLAAHPIVAGACLFDTDRMMVTGIPESFMADRITERLRATPGPLAAGLSFSELFARGHTAGIEEVMLPSEESPVPSMLIAVPVEGMVNIASGYLMAVIPVANLDALAKTTIGGGAAIVSGSIPPDTPGGVLGNSGDGPSDSVLTATSQVSFSTDDILTAVFTQHRDLLLQPVTDTVRRLSAYAVILIIIVGLFALYLARRLLTPLRRLEEQTAGYAKGDYSAPLPMFHFRELEDLSQRLAEMASKVRERQELQQTVFKAELDLLRNQMNPHFLFNTLNAISTYMTIDQAKATGMTESLASLYRMILQATKESTVPLATELAIVRAYLELETVRFGNRLTWHIDCKVDVSRYEVPGLILQTLVENAIKHGVSKSMAGGRINVGLIAGDQDACVIQVVNTGEPWRPSGKGGVGIENTRRRLDILYGTNHLFSAGPGPDGQTVVSFRVPPVRGSVNIGG